MELLILYALGSVAGVGLIAAARSRAKPSLVNNTAPSSQAAPAPSLKEQVRTALQPIVQRVLPTGAPMTWLDHPSWQANQVASPPLPPVPLMVALPPPTMPPPAPPAPLSREARQTVVPPNGLALGARFGPDTVLVPVDGAPVPMTAPNRPLPAPVAQQLVPSPPATLGIWRGDQS